MHEMNHAPGIVWMLVMGVLMVIPFWRICRRLGFHGALGLLVLIPIVNLVFFYFLAFSRWPAVASRGPNTGVDDSTNGDG